MSEDKLFLHFRFVDADAGNSKAVAVVSYQLELPASQNR